MGSQPPDGLAPCIPCSPAAAAQILHRFVAQNSLLKRQWLPEYDSLTAIVAVLDRKSAGNGTDDLEEVGGGDFGNGRREDVLAGKHTTTLQGPSEAAKVRKVSEALIRGDADGRGEAAKGEEGVKKEKKRKLKRKEGETGDEDMAARGLVQDELAQGSGRGENALAQETEGPVTKKKKKKKGKEKEK